MVYNGTVKDSEMEDPDYESAETESESEQEEDVKLSEPTKNAIYNKDGLLDKLGDISWTDKVEWIQKLTFDINGDQEVDVNDDLTRELAFYTQALDGTRQAFTKFQSMGLPFLRPSDYYAEMVKSDAHMQKVKGRLLAEKKRIEEAEERKKARESKKISKEVQAQKVKEKAKQKKQEIESVKKWRKQRQQNGFPGSNKDDGDLNLSFEEGKGFQRSNKQLRGVAPGDRSGGKAGKFSGRSKKVDGKKNNREFRNSKFGFGGKKGLRKQNTAETTSDIRGFNNSSAKKRKI